MSIKELQKIEYNLLKELTDFLEIKQLSYILCGGTMLGAVRHDGFIPWDDDVDILMPREDYDKLLNMIKNGADYPPKMKIYLPGDDDHLYPFIKACDTRYRCVDDRFRSDIPFYVWIDVFPLDHFPDELSAHRKVLRRVSFYRMILLSGIMSSEVWKKRAKGNLVVRSRHLLAFLVFILMGRHPRISKKIDSYARKMNYKYITSNHVGDGAWPNGMKDYFELKDVKPVMKHKFEDAEFNIPVNYDSYLTQFYGNYMRIPPENEREDHHISVYKVENK